MARKLTTVADLAREADLDLDEAIVMLWDVGIEEVDSPKDQISTKNLRRAQAALGIEDPKEQRTVAYWADRTGLSREELTKELAALGVRLSRDARVLPQGAMRKLRRRFENVPKPIVEDEVTVEDAPPFEWVLVGAARDVEFLSESEVCEVHKALVRDFANADDPIDPPGVRSADLLSSAVHRPRTSLGDHLKYPTVEMAAAALLHSLVLNHPFANGNKRTGIVAMLVFLDRNHIMPTCSEQDLFRFVLRVAQHGLVSSAWDSRDDREVLEMAKWIRQHTRSIARGERPMTWHKLRRVLRAYDCDLDFPGGVGNRINIYRTVSVRGRFGREKQQRLSVQCRYASEGSEIDRNGLNHIRQNLQLDEEHGIDSKVFYEAESEPDDFIQHYRTMLRRLARL